MRRCSPLTAYAESKVRAEEGLFALAGPGLRPGVDAECDRVRRRRRGCGSTSSSTTLRRARHTTGRITPAQRRDGVASAGARPRRREGGTDAARGAGGRRSAARRSTSAPTSRTTVFASWPRSSRRSPAARSRSPRARRRTTGRIASTSRSSPYPSRDLFSTGTRSEGRASSSTAYGEVGLTLEDFEGDRFVRLRRLRTLLEDGSLASDLRWSRAVALTAT